MNPNENTEITNLRSEQIQRLADGELDHEARRHLLLDLDNHETASWRDLALAFVEGQILKEVIRPAHRLRASGRRGSVIWPAMAACIAVSCFLVGRLSRSDAPTSLAVAEVVEPQQLPVYGDLRLAMENETASFVDLPVIDARGLPQFSDIQPAAELLDAANGELRQRGMEASWQTDYLSAETEDGRSIVVPVNYVSLEYRGS